ncbi:hypothetical protein SUSAZ_02065 [Sulfolobus acidocaldarius SUSAZ]|nr:hypothetical protein SUSAZ_02065 [Sulfolobus acidocaldarius SUSAZ]
MRRYFLLPLLFVVLVIASASVYYFFQAQLIFVPFVLVSLKNLVNSCLPDYFSLITPTVNNGVYSESVPAITVQATQNSYNLLNTSILNFSLSTKSYVGGYSNLQGASLSLRNFTSSYVLPVNASSGNYLLLESTNGLTSFPLTHNIYINFTTSTNSIYNYQLSVTLTKMPSANIFNYLDGDRQIGSLDYFGLGSIIIFYYNNIPIITSASGWSPNYYQQSLELVVPTSSGIPTNDQGLIFFNYTTQPNKNVTVFLIGGFGVGSNPPADGFEIYFFMNPVNINNGSLGNDYYVSNPSIGTSYLYAQGLLIFPYSKGNYFMVQWDPYWIESGASSTSAFNLFNVTPNPHNGHVNGKSITAYGPLGNNGFGIQQTSNYFYVCMKATYNPSTGWLYTQVTDLNSGKTATLSYNVGLKYPAGQYTFAIGGNTGGLYANWGIVYATIYSS